MRLDSEPSLTVGLMHQQHNFRTSLPFGRSLELRRWALSFRKNLPVLKLIAQPLARTRAAPHCAIAIEKTLDHGSLDKFWLILSA